MSFTKPHVGSYVNYCWLDALGCGSCVWRRIATRIKGKRFGNRIFVLGLLTGGTLFAFAAAPIESLEIIICAVRGWCLFYIHIIAAFVWIASIVYIIGLCRVRSSYDERVRTISNHTVVFNSKTGLYLLCGTGVLKMHLFRILVSKFWIHIQILNISPLLYMLT